MALAKKAEAKSASIITTTTRRATSSTRCSVRRFALALELDCPVVIHTREADEDTIAILDEEGDGRLRGVLHCFTGTPELRDAGLDLGFYISLAGILTFPKAADLRETPRGSARIGC